MCSENLAVDFVGSDGPCYGQKGFWTRIVLKLFVVYLLVGYWSWEELRFRASGIELPAKVERIGRTPKGLLVARYTFRDPSSNQARSNTVHVPDSLFPNSGSTSIQFISGENSQSRLSCQARPEALWIFIGMNGVLLTAFVVLIGCVAWEANRPYITPQRRMVAAYNRKRGTRKSWLDWITIKTTNPTKHG